MLINCRNDLLAPKFLAFTTCMLCNQHGLIRSPFRSTSCAPAGLAYLLGGAQTGWTARVSFGGMSELLEIDCPVL